MQLENLIKQSGEWLRAEGPEPQIVVSSRVRLARNLACHRFAAKICREERAELAGLIRNALAACPTGGGLTYFDLETMSETDRQLLVERHLISREQAAAEGARGVAINDDETLSVMVLEEDHIRLQAILGGLRPGACHLLAETLDNELAARQGYAFDQDYGYLTACPTNLGTGMRVSVMVHLPALAMTRHIEKAFRAVHDLKLTVRGLYGEGTEAQGEFYQISNQITLGRGEEDIIRDLEAVIDGIVSYEKKARERLMEKERLKVEDAVWRSWAALTHARLMTSEEAMRHLSAVRLGTYLGLVPPLECRTLNRIFIFMQPAHLQRMAGRELPPEERDALRAGFIRRELGAESRN